jgi:hypothetical protein
MTERTLGGQGADSEVPCQDCGNTDQHYTQFNRHWYDAIPHGQEEAEERGVRTPGPSNPTHPGHQTTYYTHTRSVY